MAASGAARADAPPIWISAAVPASITASSAACSARWNAPVSPVRVISFIGAWGLSRIVARPAVARTPSTAVCTTISRTPCRSRPRANDSPTRRIESCRRARSVRRSSRRASSWRAIELNSLPSAANSSLPSAGTETVKSPRPSRWAACSSRWTSACSVRPTVTANTSASSRKPKMIPITASAAVLRPFGGISASRRTVIGGRSAACAWNAVVR